MNLSIAQMLNMVQELQELAQMKMTLSAAVRVQKLVKVINEEIQLFTRTQNDYLATKREELGLKDGKEMSPELIVKINEEINKAAQEVIVEIPFTKLKLDEITQHDITPATLIVLEELFELESPEKQET